MPRSSEPWLRRIDFMGKECVTFCRNYQDDYLGQQATKLLADTFTDADFICHVDSDCVFCRPTSASDFIVSGKPLVLMQSCELLPGERPWQKPTDKFFGFPVLDDFMRHPPFTFPRWIYARLRAFAVEEHGMDIERYILRQPQRGFSEYNVLGAFAWHYYHEAFNWVELEGAQHTSAHCRWYWSWGGIDGAIRKEIGQLLKANDAA
jgi:hypothetical protein